MHSSCPKNVHGWHEQKCQKFMTFALSNLSLILNWNRNFLGKRWRFYVFILQLYFKMFKVNHYHTFKGHQLVEFWTKLSALSISVNHKQVYSKFIPAEYQTVLFCRHPYHFLTQFFVVYSDKDKKGFHNWK